MNESVRDTTIPGKGGPESNGNESVIYIPQSTRTLVSPSDAILCHMHDMSSIWPTNGTSTGTNILEQVWPESNGNGGVLYIPQSTRTGASPSDSIYAIFMTRVLLDPQTGPWQVLTLWSRADMRVMAMKGYFTFLKVPGQEPHYQMLFYALWMTRVLLDQQTGLWQILTLRGRVDLRVRTIKEYRTFPKAPGLELHYQMV